MIEFMIYPVSAVMKFWHWLLFSVLGMDTSQSWLLSIVGLIVTVRLLVLPTVWWQMVAGRKGQLLQPTLAKLQQEFEARTDADAFKWHQEQRKQLHKENSYNPMAGCIPALIQLPVLIGLYQVLLRMARPAEGLDSTHKPIGFLTSEDVAEFLQVRFMDVPLPAYIAMSPERLAELGTTKELTVGVITMFVLAACVFTATNLSFSVWRSYRTMNWSSRISVGVVRLISYFIVIVPIMLLFSAFTAPLPLAIMMYWFGGNLWTMTQFFILTWLLEKKYPLTEEFIAKRDAEREQYKKNRKTRQAIKNRIRKHRLLMILQPHRAGEHRRAIKGIKDRVWELHHEATKDKRENARLRREAQKEAKKEAKKKD